MRQMMERNHEQISLRFGINGHLGDCKSRSRSISVPATRHRCQSLVWYQSLVRCQSLVHGSWLHQSRLRLHVAGTAVLHRSQYQQRRARETELRTTKNTK